jgi:hypothetical protein
MSVLLLQAVSRFEMFQRSFEAASSQISQNFLIDQQVAPLPSFVQKAVRQFKQIALFLIYSIEMTA